MFLILAYRRCYIRFIRKVNDKKGIEGQEETKKAFDFMLNYVGKLILIVPLVFRFSLDYYSKHLGDDDGNSPKVVQFGHVRKIIIEALVRGRFIRDSSRKVNKKAEDCVFVCLYMHVFIFVLILIHLSNDVLTGADISSGPVWMEYISFLKSLPVS